MRRDGPHLLRAPLPGVARPLAGAGGRRGRGRRMASEAGVVVNAFAIGHDAVSRSGNGALERMADRSGGRYVELEKPGDVVPALESTSLVSVDRVELANRTTGRGTRAVATGIDGSFAGRVRLAAGVDELGEAGA